MNKPEELDKQDTNHIEVIEIPEEESDSANFLVTEQLQKMPGIFSHGLFFLILIMLCAALLYSVFGKIDIVIESMSVTRPESHKIRILSDRNGYIEKIYISEGEVVEKNSPLFLIRSKEIPRCKTKVKGIKRGGQLNKEKDTSLQSLRGDSKKMNDIPLTADDSSIYSDTTGACNIIRAEQSGTVSEMYFRNQGEYIKEFDLLSTILPLNSPLYMDIIVANEDIGFLEKGMPIKYKFDAFPHIDYGILEGRVLYIPPSAVEDSSLGFVYHLRGSLDNLNFEIRGKQYPVKAGMTATAEIVTGRKNIFSVLFMKFKR